jgi:hypothetical protein
MSKLTEAARGEACILCGKNDGTTVAAHINGPLASKLGRGMGQKPDDIFCAHLCHQCHDQMDGRVPCALPHNEMLELWPELVMLTQRRLREMGIL